jgi:hypothetical protein
MFSGAFVHDEIDLFPEELAKVFALGDEALGQIRFLNKWFNETPPRYEAIRFLLARHVRGQFETKPKEVVAHLHSLGLVHDKALLKNIFQRSELWQRLVVSRERLVVLNLPRPKESYFVSLPNEEFEVDSQEELPYNLPTRTVRTFEPPPFPNIYKSNRRVRSKHHPRPENPNSNRRS